MKLEYYNINEFTIYLNNDYMQKIRFDLEDNKEENFRNLLDRLKDIYNLDLYGYYRVIVYINDNYGIIVELYKEDDEYIKIFGESLDLKILFKPESKILDIIKVDNKNEYLNLLEDSKIIYGKDIDNLLHNMIKI